MAEQTHLKSNSQNDSQTLVYPSPISPLLPPISKLIEQNRAKSAAAKSDLFSLSQTQIVFEDDSFIVVNKPSGVYCEAVLSSIPRLLAGSSDLTKMGVETAPLELHLANRLDRDTSGVMVITKSHKVAGKLVKAFTEHKVKKTYIGLCIGSVPKWQKIVVRSGHGRSRFGVWRVYAASDVGRTLPGGTVVRHMETSFEVLSVNKQQPTNFRVDDVETLVAEEDQKDSKINEMATEKGAQILIRAYPRSGRTHQIRLHCQYLGIPIRGDVKYHGVHEWKAETYETHSLHAESLLFDHPITHVPIEVHAPLPLWASDACCSVLQGPP